MRSTARSRDAVAGLVAAALGLVYLVAAFRIEPDPSATAVMGPRAAPIVIGAATVICALALLVRGLRAGAVPGETPDDAGGPEAREEAGPGQREEVGGGERRRSRREVLVLFGILAAYVVAFIPLGYLLSTFAFLVGLTTYVERGRLVRNCVFAAVFAAAVYVLFDYGLQVTLPAGPLG